MAALLILLVFFGFLIVLPLLIVGFVIRIAVGLVRLSLGLAFGLVGLVLAGTLLVLPLLPFVAAAFVIWMFVRLMRRQPAARLSHPTS
jgi:hypothetical protein